MIPFAVILPAAGLSLRYGKPKLLEPLEGSSVIARSVAAFATRRDVTAIVIPTQATDTIVSQIPSDSQITFAPGGENRAESVRNALSLIDESIEFVAVHDGARPLVSQALIDRVLEAAIASGAAGPALPVHLHIRRAVHALPASSSGTVPRHDLFAMQTPQIMRSDLLRKAFAHARDLSSITDDLQLLEAIGVRPALVLGEEQNLKITTPNDLLLARILLNSAGNISRA